MNGAKQLFSSAVCVIFLATGLTPADNRVLHAQEVGQPAIRPITDKSPLRVWVDQIGYRTNGRKLLVVAGSQPLPREIDLQVVNAKTGQRSSGSCRTIRDALKIKNGGKKDGESGDYVAHLDLSAFKIPGRYYVQDPGGSPPERSYIFNIGDYVYRDSGIAAWKSLYFQRADGPKPEKYAGPWNDSAAYWGPGQAKDAKVYHWEKNQHWDPICGSGDR